MSKFTEVAKIEGLKSGTMKVYNVKVKDGKVMAEF